MLASFLTLLLVPLARAANSVAGVGQLNSGGVQTSSFSMGSYEDTVQSIFASLTQGPNRTLAASVPVKKVYGVNVSCSTRKA
jgi:hypothetical protein